MEKRIKRLLGERDRLNATLPSCVSKIETESHRMLDTVEKTEKELSACYLRMLQGNMSKEEMLQKEESLKRASNNLLKAWSQTYSMRDELHARWKDIKRQKKKHRLFSAPPSNAAIDLREKQTVHFFAKGMNPYKLLLITYIGSFAGVVVEMVWCLLTRGYIESRAGLVYGPFNPLYGAGAVLLTVCLYKYRNRGSWLSFIGGMLVGSILEYVCSWGEELVLGSRSWDYSNMPFNINGRICLLYSIFWGLLSVFWIKNLYPRISKWILKIPNRMGKIITWLLTVFFVFNILMSGIAMFRWSQRIEGIAPSNAFWEWVDERFPDERMENVYANMKFTNKSEELGVRKRIINAIGVDCAHKSVSYKQSAGRIQRKQTVRNLPKMHCFFNFKF